MSGEIWKGGAWRSLSRAETYRGGAWRRLTRGEVYKGGQWRQFVTFIPPLTASASPSSTTGLASNFRPTRVTSGSVTITPVGGLGPYTYSWDGDGLTATNPSSATTTFYAAVGAGLTTTADPVCTVTDALGSPATASTHVELTNEGA